MIVSSPYHMRRLKLIADKVFGDGDYRVGFEATPFEEYGVLNCLRSWAGFWNVAGEYVKIGWFLVIRRLWGIMVEGFRGSRLASDPFGRSAIDSFSKGLRARNEVSI